MKKFSIFAITLVSFLFLFSTNIFSQEVEEVVVTATKKEESVQDLALSVEAFTSESITENMIEDFSDLAEAVPGLIMDKGIGSGASYSIRGTGSYGVGAAVIGSVVTAINGHNYNSSSIADIGFFDVERIEVLKGPQGTKFGRNAVAGLINMITARPTREFEGAYSIELGNLSTTQFNGHVNIPISDSVRSRFAVVSKKRDGTTYNIHTKNYFNDINSWGARFSLDWDIGDSTILKFTTEHFEGDDNRTNVGTAVCQSDPFFGCNPLVTGQPNQTPDSRGTTAALFNLIAALDFTADRNSYAGAITPNTFREANLNRDPVHQQTSQSTSLELNHELSDELLLNVQITYNHRDYYHSNDNDYSVSNGSFPGLAAIPGFPMTWFGCFGGYNGTGFCESVDSDRTYEFSVVQTYGTQFEVSLISDFDGPFNYTVGAYTFNSKNHNVYQVQTASWNMISKAVQHPYNDALFGGALTGYGGTDFFTALVLGAPATLAPAGLMALLMSQPKYEVPREISGFINDDHVRTESTAFYGEIYYDFSDTTKLTLGLRYNDDTVTDNLMSCLTMLGCDVYPLSQRLTGEYGFFPTTVVESDDALAYKLALQHDISDNVMVYGSYTTATKAGGNNPNETGTPDPYDPEETGVFELGIKSILMDGALLLNATYFDNSTDGMLISSIVNAGSRNNNVDAEIQGFEGNMVFFLSESTRLDATWLLVDSEIKDFSLIDPLNINNHTSILAGPVNVDPQGLLRYVVTDKGTLFKSAGYMCTEAFNPLGGVPCALVGGLGTPVDVSGNQLPQSPETSYSLALNQDFNSSSGVTTARLTYRYQAEREGNVFNYERARMPEHKFIDLSFTYKPNDKDWYISLYGKNLGDEVTVGTWAAASAIQGGTQFATYTDPRTYGIMFGTSF
jgi:outer membrane receptor protein involved in Fe transport